MFYNLEARSLGFLTSSNTDQAVLSKKRAWHWEKGHSAREKEHDAVP